MTKTSFIICVALAILFGALALLCFLLSFIGFTFNTCMSIDLGACVAFDLFFWVISFVLSAKAIEIYRDYKKEESYKKNANVVFD